MYQRSEKMRVIEYSLQKLGTTHLKRKVYHSHSHGQKPPSEHFSKVKFRLWITIFNIPTAIANLFGILNNNSEKNYEMKQVKQFF